MFGLLEKVAKTAVSVASLPVTVAHDIITAPMEDTEAITPKAVNALSENLEKIATGEWDDDDSEK